MDPKYRRIFNNAFSPSLYESYCRRLSERLNTRFEFRLAESPVFLPPDLRGHCFKAAQEILAQLSDPGRIERMKKAVPAEWNVPGMDDLPSFAQIDFAITRSDDGELVPRLVELQGFPSLTAFQVVQRDVWTEVLATIPGLDENWSCWLSGLDREQFLHLARRTILGDQDAEHLIRMDIAPPSQKTSPDFAATKILFDVDAVCPTALVRKDAKLFRRVRGTRERLTEVKRIYNRVVFDELIQKQLALPFRF